MTHYYLDTSVLMNIDDFKAQAEDTFEEYEEYITYHTFLELDGLKKSQILEKQLAARKAFRYIRENEIRIIFPRKTNFINRLAMKFSRDTTDMKIIHDCYWNYVDRKLTEPAVFCTYDYGQYILMRTVLLEKPLVRGKFSAQHFVTLAEHKESLVPYYDDITEGKGWIKSSILGKEACLLQNQYWIDGETEEIKRNTLLQNEDFTPISYKPIHSHFMGEVKPRNPQQEMLFDLLQNPDIKVKLALGKFGSGKSFVMLAHAIDLVQRGKFDKLIFIRNTISVKDTKDIGALPGGLYEKLWPYLMAVADHVGGEDGLMQLIDDHIIEPVHLGYLRGRDFKRCIIFCDECEHLTKQHVQLILGRAAEGSEVWFAGDLKQRDSKVFETNSGIVRMLKKLTGNPLFGTVTLVKSERSEVAQLADELD